MNENFNRSYTLVCGPSGGKGFRLTNTLHISFSVEKSDSESSNTAKVQIWNLSPENLKILGSKKLVCELKAGYGENMPTILRGAVTYVCTSNDGADRVTELQVVDGNYELSKTHIAISKNGKINTKDLYELVANKMGCSIKFAKDVAFKSHSHGFSFVGRGGQAIKKLAKYNGHKWSMQNGVIYVTTKSKKMERKGFVLSASTGLVGSPKKIKISDSDSDSELSGWEVDYLLNGAIGISDVIKLESNNAKGDFLVHKVTLNGDNFSGDWQCKAELLKG